MIILHGLTPIDYEVYCQTITSEVREVGSLLHIQRIHAI